MKKLLLFGALALAFVPASLAGGARNVTVAMHEPGCHAFLVGGKYKTSLTVKGAVSLRNVDEAALVVRGAGTTKRVRVLGKITLRAKGTYVIKMVKQEKMDNTLRLTIR